MSQMARIVFAGELGKFWRTTGALLVKRLPKNGTGSAFPQGWSEVIERDQARTRMFYKLVVE